MSITEKIILFLVFLTAIFLILWPIFKKNKISNCGLDCEQCRLNKLEIKNKKEEK